MGASWANGLCGKNLHDITDPANVYTSPSGMRQCDACRVVRVPRTTSRPLRHLMRAAGLCWNGLHDMTDPTNVYARPGRAERCCRACRNARLRERTSKAEGGKSHHGGRRHGILTVDLDQLWEEQGGRCAICLKVPVAVAGRRPYVVDHDHSCCPGPASCGRCVRGLICAPCNNGLGFFRDDRVLLHRAAMYVRQGSVIGSRLDDITEWIVGWAA